MILYGKPVSDQVKESLKKDIENFSTVLKSELDMLSGGLHKNLKPKLAIVQVGHNPRSDVYISRKKQFAKDIGVDVLHIELSEDITIVELRKGLSGLSEDTSIHGIIMQMPLPPRFSAEEVWSCMDIIPNVKDVDGLTSANITLINNPATIGQAIVPATARAITMILDHYEISVKDKTVAVIGRSNLVGNPTAKLLESLGAHVLIGHKDSGDIRNITTISDIIISATGVPGLIDSSHLGDSITKGKKIIIDVGISVKDGKIVGDVKFEEVFPLVEHITPVPGGVGPVTVSALFYNIVDAFKKQIKI